MQTFITEYMTEDVGPLRLTYRSAQSLDSARLGKQRVETKQIYTSLTTGQGWVHHPATKMWEGKLEALATYGFIICQVWRERGFADELMDWFEPLCHQNMADGFNREQWPWWYGNKHMVAAHRSKLISKNPQFYMEKWAAEPDWVRSGAVWQQYPLPYLWPDAQRIGVFTISGAEYKRRDTAREGYRLPPTWEVNDKTREVTIHE